MAEFDPRLLRPVLVPRVANIMLVITMAIERMRKQRVQAGAVHPAT